MQFYRRTKKEGRNSIVLPSVTLLTGFCVQKLATGVETVIFWSCAPPFTTLPLTG